MADILDLSLTKHYDPLFIELDITDSRKLLNEQKRKYGKKYSFSSWIIYCIGQAMAKHKRLNVLPHKNKYLVLFDDVDITIALERKVPEEDIPGETLAMSYIIRKANEKTIEGINSEIRSARNEEIKKGQVRLGLKNAYRDDVIFTRLPKFIRHLYFWRRVNKNAFLFKKTLGTVVVSSLSSFSSTGGYVWLISRNPHPISVLIGPVIKKPAIIDGAIVERQYLCMTMAMRHELYDGVPFLRFVKTFKDLVESGEGLVDK